MLMDLSKLVSHAAESCSTGNRTHPEKISDKAGRQGAHAYNSHLPPEVIFDLSGLDGIGGMLLNDLR